MGEAMGSSIRNCSAPQSFVRRCREVIREQMNDLAQNRPNEVAQVLRNWLVEEKTS